MAFYELLKQELQNDPLNIGYATMSDEDVAAALSQSTRTRIRTRFISLRTLASILTADEYSTVKRALQRLASSDMRVADMLEVLKMPCDDMGNNGGIDIGFPTVRAMIQALPDVPDETKQKILALAEEPCARWQEIGLECAPNKYHIESARRMMGG